MSGSHTHHGLGASDIYQEFEQGHDSFQIVPLGRALTSNSRRPHISPASFLFSSVMYSGAPGS